MTISTLFYNIGSRLFLGLEVRDSVQVEPFNSTFLCIDQQQAISLIKEVNKYLILADRYNVI